MASTSSKITASKSKSKARRPAEVPVIDTSDIDLATYAGRSKARVRLYVAACLQGDFKAAASVVAEAGKDSMRQQRYGKGAGGGPRVTLVFGGAVRERLAQSRKWLEQAKALPTAPGPAPMRVEHPVIEDARDDAHTQREAGRGDNNGHAPPTTAAARFSPGTM